MKNIDIGTLFSIPLTINGEEIFLYGYITYNGEFLLAEIFTRQGNSKEIPENIEESPLLLKDFIIDWMLFSKPKHEPELRPWLKSKKIVSELKGPHDPLFVLGGHTSRPLIFDVRTETQRPALPGEEKQHQSVEVDSRRYYSVFLEAKILGKNVGFDQGTKKYIVTD